MRPYRFLIDESVKSVATCFPRHRIPSLLICLQQERNLVFLGIPELASSWQRPSLGCKASCPSPVAVQECGTSTPVRQYTDPLHAVDCQGLLRHGKWSSISPHQRTRFLLKIADLIEQHTDELTELETLDCWNSVRSTLISRANLPRRLDSSGTGKRDRCRHRLD